MKTVTHYECEICGGRFATPEGAEVCEARGRGPEYPIGTIYGNHYSDCHHDKDLCFAVAENDLVDHYNNGASWACRDNGCGDSLGDELCGGPSLSLGEHDGHVDLSHPTTRRMIQWMRGAGIKPLLWNGIEAVELPEGV